MTRLEQFKLDNPVLRPKWPTRQQALHAWWLQRVAESEEGWDLLLPAFRDSINEARGYRPRRS
jgi:hypothetical protein